MLNRWYATKIAREWNVPAEGVGYVTRFDVERSYLDRYEVHQAGGRDVLEYWIPAEELADLTAHIVGAITEEADYRGPVNDQEFTDVDKALGRPLPAEWRSCLQGESWVPARLDDERSLRRQLATRDASRMGRSRRWAPRHADHRR